MSIHYSTKFYKSRFFADLEATADFPGTSLFTT